MTSLSAKIDEIQRELNEMFEEVHGMVRRIVDELRNLPSGGNPQDLYVALENSDQVVDDLDVKIEDHCLKFLALQQPVAIDLRQIIAASRIIGDLERIADFCVSISKRLTGAANARPTDFPMLIVEMGQRAEEMLARVLLAYRQSDVTEAERIRAEDDIIDGMNRESINAIISDMYDKRSNMDAMLDLFSITRFLERIADHASNIAEEIIFLVEGRIVRHKDPQVLKPEAE